MGIEGNLETMNLPTLVQFAVQEKDTLHIQITHEQREGSLYFQNGDLQHAVMHYNAPSGARSSYTGEDVVYELLRWQNGRFLVEKNIPPPTHTITKKWDFILMEGLRLLDEHGVNVDGPTPISTTPTTEPTVSEMLSDLSDEDASAIHALLAQQMESDNMATKREQLQSILTKLVSTSSDITGAVIVDNDGLLLASALSANVDGNRIAAVTAGLISLAGRSAQQLGQGGVKQTLIQAENGNVVAIRASTKGSFVALTPTGINLGMTFMECQDAANEIGNVLD